MRRSPDLCEGSPQFQKKRAKHVVCFDIEPTIMSDELPEVKLPATALRMHQTAYG
jgi:hypothetical protein